MSKKTTKKKKKTTTPIDRLEARGRELLKTIRRRVDDARKEGRARVKKSWTFEPVRKIRDAVDERLESGRKLLFGSLGIATAREMEQLGKRLDSLSTRVGKLNGKKPARSPAKKKTRSKSTTTTRTR